MSFKLEVAGSDKVYSLHQRDYTIGRAPTCDIVIDDPSVSRLHARVSFEQDTPTIKSMTHYNLVSVNKAKVQSICLKPGDHISLGNTELVVSQDDSPATDSDSPFIDSTIVLQSSLKSIMAESKEVSSHVGEISFGAVYRASQAINSTLDMSELFTHLAKVIFDEVPFAEYFSIHFYDQTRESITFRFGCRKKKNAKSEKIEYLYSTTLIGHVIKSGKAVLTNNALDDSRFGGALSIIQHSIHSAVCVPIFSNQQTIGALQVVTTKTGCIFSQEDFKLLAIIGSQVGTAIQNVRHYEELNHARILQNDKRRFMQVMIHELKSPLSAAKLMMDTLFSGLVPEERQAEFREKILNRTTDLQQLIVDILKFSKFSDEETLGEVQKLNLPEFLEQFSEEFKRDAEIKDLEFIMDNFAEELFIRIEVQALQLILSNLLSNAIKYTNEGFVKLSLTREGDHAKISISDSGIGIPEKDVPNLFKEFFRASNARKSDIEGTGVGLAGIKLIIERIGGELVFETKENEGSTFTVLLQAQSQSLLSPS